MLTNDSDISENMMNEVESMSDDEKSLDTISYASNNGMAKSSQRVQKHDDGRNGFDSPRIKFTQI